MDHLWDADAPGVLTLPSGVRVRGRGLRHPVPEGPLPTFGVHLLSKEPAPTEPTEPTEPTGWPIRWVRWPDFRLPSDPDDLRSVLVDALARAAGERVEFACHGGRGRTGTALACLAVLDGVPPGEAVAFVRQHYRPHAVETFAQRRFVRRFSPGVSDGPATG